MKNIIYIIACSLIMASCNTTSETKTTNIDNTVDTATATPMVGADKDDHGCKGSAGYTYSTLLQDCIRTWEVGIMLNPISTTQQDVNIISVIFDKQNTKAELFILDVKGTVLLDKKADETFGNDTYKLNKAAGKWQLSKGDVVINKE